VLSLERHGDQFRMSINSLNNGGTLAITKQRKQLEMKKFGVIKRLGAAIILAITYIRVNIAPRHHPIPTSYHLLFRSPMLQVAL
jgi:hypothetical protein